MIVALTTILTCGAAIGMQLAVAFVVETLAVLESSWSGYGLPWQVPAVMLGLIGLATVRQGTGRL